MPKAVATSARNSRVMHHQSSMTRALFIRAQVTRGALVKTRLTRSITTVNAQHNISRSRRPIRSTTAVVRTSQNKTPSQHRSYVLLLSARSSSHKNPTSPNSPPIISLLSQYGLYTVVPNAWRASGMCPLYPLFLYIPTSLHLSSSVFVCPRCAPQWVPESDESS